MTRTASDQDLYRRLDQVAESLRQQQQGLLQGLFNPFVYPPCDYATTANVDLTAVFTSITDVQAGSPTLAAQGGMRILVWQQTNKIDNGIYEVGTDNYLHRVADMLVGATALSGARVFVRSGYAFGGRDFFVIGANKIVGTAAMTISPPRGATIDDQIFRCGSDNPGTYAVPAATYTPVWTNAANTIPLTLSYTPPVDCWWQVDAWVYYAMSVAAYTYVNPQLYCTPVPPGGSSTGSEDPIMGGMYNGVVTYATVNLHEKFRLTAGVAYTAGVKNYSQIAGINQQKGDRYTGMRAVARVM